MSALKRHLKRILIDTAGYLLILAGILLGWVPGPGGIPLILAGLGLLSLYNPWARSLRTYLLKHGGRLTEILFPDSLIIQTMYDIAALAFFVIATLLAIHHRAIWEISVAVVLFFLAVFVAGLNRGRYHRIKRKHK